MSCVKFMLPVAMTGMATRLLPDGVPLDRPVFVAWSRPSGKEPGMYAVGLAFMG